MENQDIREESGIRRNSEPRIDEIRRAVKPIAVSYADPRTLVPADRNSRHHTQRQVAQLGASIREFGFIVPIVIDDRGVVIAGHGRLAAALQCNLGRVPVVQIDHLSNDQKRAFRLADNRLAELSHWDEDVLKIELAELSALNLAFDVEVTGFDTVDFDRLTGATSPAKQDPADILPTLNEGPAVARLGDTWRLGGHRVLCGDACIAEHYKLLLQNNTAAMVCSDPPYNVRIQGHVTTRSVHREFVMASGEMSPQEFVKFLERSFRLTRDVSNNGSIHFVFMDWRHMAEILAAAAPVYGAPKQLAVWVKDNAGLGTFYRSGHELVFIFKVGDAPHINNFGLGERGRYRTNIWRYPGLRSIGGGQSDLTDMHPTVKPVAMVADAIKDCSHRRDIVLDPFGGSGTTLIAAERTHRYARLIELDPFYVDLIIRRWQTFTGESAIHESSGQTFEEISHLRSAPGTPS